MLVQHYGGELLQNEINTLQFAIAKRLKPNNKYSEKTLTYCFY
jgi:hypothetical protein